jgi:hypothetical protein
MGWLGDDPPPPDPNVGIAARENAELAREQAALSREQLDWSRQVYERDYLPAMQRDAALRQQLQDAYLGSMRKQDEYADYQFNRYRNTFAPLEDDLVAEAKRGVNVEGRVGRAVADYAQQSSLQERQMIREANRNNMGNGTAMAYAMAANKNADALGAAGLATNIRAAAEGEDFARRAAVAGMGRGLVMDTGNFMQGANAAGGQAGNNSAQGMGIMGQGNDFMRGGYGTASSMYGAAANSWGNVGQLGLGLSNYNMQGYQAGQSLLGDTLGAVGTAAGMFFGGPAGAAAGKALFGKADGGLVQKYADGGEVDQQGEYDPRSIAEDQVNTAMGLKAGGPVSRRPPKVRPGSTTQRGGKVSGPGGPKDDRVPALLSDGEFVMPVGAVKKYGLDKLEKMRQDGLQFEKQLGITR